MNGLLNGQAGLSAYLNSQSASQMAANWEYEQAMRNQRSFGQLIPLGALQPPEDLILLLLED